MKFQIITPPAVPLLDISDALAHCRIDDATEGDYIAILIDAATRYAEEKMETSLISQTIQATFYAGDILYLPRGPIQSITTVSINGIAQSSSTYSIESQGNTDVLRFNNGNIQPLAAPATLVVTYVAGFGAGASDVPQDIRQVVRCHVGMLYISRELASSDKVNSVPFMDEFYRLRSRGTGVG